MFLFRVNFSWVSKKVEFGQEMAILLLKKHQKMKKFKGNLPASPLQFVYTGETHTTSILCGGANEHSNCFA